VLAPSSSATPPATANAASPDAPPPRDSGLANAGALSSGAPNSAAAGVDGGIPDEVAVARSVLERWNDAHTAHDTAALGALYADRVLFYADPGRGARIPGADCVRLKAAAFGRAPDYAQSIQDAKFFPDGSGGTYVEFTKVSTIAGKKKRYDAYLFVDSGRIVAEGDGKEGFTVRWNWCVHDIPLSSSEFLGVPRDAAIGGFKVAPLEAVRAAARSKRANDLARSHSVRTRVVITGCPYLCAMDDPRGPMAEPPCENKSGAYTLEIQNASTGDGLEEVEVDAMTRVMTSKDTRGFREPLTEP
jgi:hypothetical protein